MRDDAHALDAEQWCAAVIGVVEAAEDLRDHVLLDAARREHAEDELRHRLVELEQHVADEAIADDDVERAARASRGQDVTPFDVADEVEPRTREQLVRFLHGRVPLLGFLAVAQQSDRGLGAAEDVLGVDGAEPRELHELLGGAIDVRARVDEHDRLLERGDHRRDRGAREPVMQLEQEDGGRHLCAGVASGDEGVRLFRRVQLEAHDHGAVRLAADGGRGTVGHLDDVRCFDDADAIARAMRTRCGPARRGDPAQPGSPPCGRRGLPNVPGRAREGRAARLQREHGERDRPPWHPRRSGPS